MSSTFQFTTRPRIQTLSKTDAIVVGLVHCRCRGLESIAGQDSRTGRLTGPEDTCLDDVDG